MDTPEQAELARYREEAAEATIAASVATSLAGRQLATGSAEQLTKLFRKDIRLVDDGTGKRVPIGPAGQSVGDFVSTQLGKQEYSHFLASSDRGGPSRPAAPGGAGGATGQPATLAQAFRQHIAEQQAPGRDGPVNGYRAMPMQPVYKKE
jgi:hypothetical protein